MRRRWLTLSVVALMGGSLAACGPQSVATTATDLTGFATRYAAAWGSQHPDSLASFYEENGTLVVNAGAPSVGRAAIRATAEGFMTAFPDMRVVMDSVTGQGGHAVFYWHWTGTNIGPGGTGNAVDLHGYEEWTLGAGGLIAESQGYYDPAAYQQQVTGHANAP